MIHRLKHLLEYFNSSPPKAKKMTLACEINPTEHECLLFMIHEINRVSKPKSFWHDGKSVEITVTYLHTAWVKANIPLVSSRALFSPGDYLKWEKALYKEGVFGRTDKLTNQPVLLRRLLESARNAWQQDQNFDESVVLATSARIEQDKLTVEPVVQPNYMSGDKGRLLVPEEDKEFYSNICEYITKNTQAKTNSFKILALDLFKAAQLANIHYQINKDTLSADDYIDWATVLKRNFGYEDRQYLKLEEVLKCAVADERRNKRGGGSSVEHAATSKRVVKETRREENVSASSIRSVFSEIHIEDFDSSQLLDSDTIVSRQCEFCSKETIASSRPSRLIKQLVGTNSYCSFCVRNDFHSRQKHIMILTLRGMIGYMYAMCYFGKNPSLYLSELEDFVSVHISAGQQNPLFTYDADTFCWFVDFSKVGDGKFKIPMYEVIGTVNEMVSAFNPYNYIREFKSHKYTERFKESIVDFYERRYRPMGKRICAPTLVGCASDLRDTKSPGNKKIDISVYRNFLPTNLRLSLRR